MKIDILAIGKSNDHDPFIMQINEYMKRLRWDVKIKEIAPVKSNSVDAIKTKETKALLDKCDKNSSIVVLDIAGHNYCSREFKDFLLRESDGRKITFIIGGSDGFDKSLFPKNAKFMSFSRMTMPHLMARLVLVEQLYRSYTMINNHPYHK